MGSSHQEKRGFIRVPFSTKVEVRCQGRSVQADGEADLSMSGIRVFSDEELPPDSPCRVKIILEPSVRAQIIEAGGRVVRTEPGKLAVEFTELDLDGYWHLRQLILHNAEDPDRAEQEFEAHWGIRQPSS